MSIELTFFYFLSLLFGAFGLAYSTDTTISENKKTLSIFIATMDINVGIALLIYLLPTTGTIGGVLIIGSQFPTIIGVLIYLFLFRS